MGVLMVAIVVGIGLFVQYERAAKSNIGQDRHSIIQLALVFNMYGLGMLIYSFLYSLLLFYSFLMGSYYLLVLQQVL